MGAQPVPENKNLDSEDAWETLRRVQYLPLLRRSLRRFHEADAYSYARAIGFQVVLTFFPALIFSVAVAVWADSTVLQSAIEAVVAGVTPGSTSDFLQQAIEQGQQNARGSLWPTLGGGLTALISGAIGMSQVQLGAGRIYGKDEDRAGFSRYRLSFLLSLSVGLLLAGAFLAISFGGTIADAVEGESVWSWLRWPLGALGAVVAIAVLYKFAPNRSQPRVSWLVVGSVTATVLWILFSAGLALFLALSSTFGASYGSLAGLIGFLIWAQLTGLAVLSGLALAAQLEAETDTPGTDQKLAERT